MTTLTTERSRAMIIELIGCMRRANEEDEERIQTLLEEITSSFEPETAVLAEQAIKDFRAALGTDPTIHPRLWAHRFKRFTSVTEQIYKINGIEDTDTI